MKNYIRIFQLRAVLNITSEGVTYTNQYEQAVKVRFLGKRSLPPAYDAESRRYFGTDDKLFTFELEIDKVKLFLSKELIPASEFLRATHYRYDWIRLLTNQQGNLLKVLNKDEIQQSWEKMKTLLSKNYSGATIELYLEKLNKQMYTDRPLFAALSQYLYFGLVFPNIPIRHNANRVYTRKIELSEEDQEVFDETITFVSSSDGLNKYNIEGKIREGSISKLSKFEGTMHKKPSDLFPKSADVEIEFNRDEVVTQWNFELKETYL